MPYPPCKKYLYLAILWLTVIYAHSFVEVPINICAASNPGKKANTSIQQKFSYGLFLFAALDKDNSIAVYILDSITGELKFVEKEDAPGRVGSLTISNSKKYLYAAIRSTHQIATYEIDNDLGKLRPIQNILVADDPVYISTDKTNTYLLTVYYNAGKLAIYPIVGDSIISDSAVLNETIGIQPHYVQTDPQNKYLYIPLKGSDQILQYSFNESDGNINKLNPPSVNSVKGAGPRHMAFHPWLDFIYVTNELNNSISQYCFNKSTGLLELHKPDLSTLPDDFDETNTVADIHITPNGKYVYVSNRGHHSIAAFSIDTITGVLSTIDHYKTEPIPREFDISPDGNFLIAGGEGSGYIRVYKINENGTLCELNRYQAGIKVTWILCEYIPW